jgi:hypothetical protein
MNVSSPIKIVVSLVVVAALVATRFSSTNTVSAEWIVVKWDACMTLLSDLMIIFTSIRFASLRFSLFISE